MIIAELQGKIPSKLEDKEDILTSNVFSFFKYSNRLLLKEYLRELGLDVSFNDAKDAEFQFWINYDDGTEPDLVVLCGMFYILFEAKLYSDFAPKKGTVDSQIRREINMGKMAAKNNDKEFVYVAITAEYYKEESKYSKYESQEHKFIWTNWQHVAKFLEVKLAIGDTLKDDDFASDLYSLLVKKRLRSYSGLEELINPIYINCPEIVFYNLETSKFKGEYTGYIESLKGFPKIESYLKFYTRSFFENLPSKPTNHIQKIFYHGN
ncbi:MAG: hypothetical protein ABFS32_20720 [Bacteroidota bacterium]